MPLLGPKCTYCAYPLVDASYPICGLCIKKKPHFDRAFIHYAFEEPLRSLIHQFKYQKGFFLSSFLSHLMLHSLEVADNRPECLIPVPMHAQRMKRRGFNQAAVLTQALAKYLRLPYDFTSCQKIRNTLPQVHLDKKERKRNLRLAFKVKKLPYRHVALVDDLLTTGCTANELAYTLKQSGVEQVDVWCCARTIVSADHSSLNELKEYKK